MLIIMKGSFIKSSFQKMFLYGHVFIFFLVVFTAKIYVSKKGNKQREKVYGAKPEKTMCKFPRVLSQWSHTQCM